MVLNLQTEEGAQFEELWAQYGDIVYNLAVRLEGSSKQGWVLARAAFLEARQDIKSMEGRMPALWLREMVVKVWMIPYLQNRTFWRRHFGKKTLLWSMRIPHMVNADLNFLAEEQEALLHWLKMLDHPVRLAAVLHLADEIPSSEIARITPYGKHQIEKFSKKAAERLAELLKSSGASVPATKEARQEKVVSVLRHWKMLTAPMTLKVDIMSRRISQKEMSHPHIPNQISIKGIYIVLALAIAALTGFLAYCWIIGHHHAPSLIP